MERVEMLKQDMLRRIKQEVEVPENLNKILDNYLEQIELMYKKLSGNHTGISEYIEGKKCELEMYIKKLGQEKKDFQISDLNYAIKKIEEDPNKEQEEKETIQKKREEERNKDNIKSIIVSTNKVTGKVLQALEDTLKNIKVASMRLLSANQFSDKKIQEIEEQIHSNINYNKQIIEEKIYKEFQDTDQKLVSDLIKMYEQYISEKQAKVSAREEFAESLDAEISLEDQAKFVEEKKKELQEKSEETKVMSLPDDVLR